MDSALYVTQQKIIYINIGIKYKNKNNKKK